MEALPQNPKLRSQPARDRILEAARAVFAREGYERATVRLVAAEAGVHPSMLARYYGNKEEMFAVAAEIDLRLPGLTDRPRSTLGLLLAGHFVERWEASGAGGQLPALLRACVSHDAARTKVIAIFEQQVRSMLQAVEGLDRIDTRAALIASQLLGIGLARHVIQIPSAMALDHNTLVIALAGTIQTYLDLTLPKDTAGATE